MDIQWNTVKKKASGRLGFQKLGRIGALSLAVFGSQIGPLIGANQGPMFTKAVASEYKTPAAARLSGILAHQGARRPPQDAWLADYNSYVQEAYGDDTSAATGMDSQLRANNSRSKRIEQFMKQGKTAMLNILTGENEAQFPLWADEGFRPKTVKDWAYEQVGRPQSTLYDINYNPDSDAGTGSTNYGEPEYDQG